MSSSSDSPVEKRNSERSLTKVDTKIVMYQSKTCPAINMY